MWCGHGRQNLVYANSLKSNMQNEWIRVRIVMCIILSMYILYTSRTIRNKLMIIGKFCKITQFKTLGWGVAVFSTCFRNELVRQCMSQQINSSQVFQIASAFWSCLCQVKGQKTFPHFEYLREQNNVLSHLTFWPRSTRWTCLVAILWVPWDFDAYLPDLTVSSKNTRIQIYSRQCVIL